MQKLIKTMLIVIVALYTINNIIRPDIYYLVD
jgi:hypothetical protein